jgi:hypothetical protein
MTDLGLWLSGVSFVLALAGFAIAVAEHRRAERAETALAASQEKLWASILRSDELSGQQAKLVADLAQQDVTLERMIRAVAAASTPIALPSDSKKVFISVPGPGTLQ